MCYSAKVKQKLRELDRQFGERPDYRQIVELFLRRIKDPKIQISRAFEDNFSEPRNEDERQIKQLIAEHRATLETDLIQEMFAQRQRQTAAEQALKIKVTKKAENDARIGAKKADQAKAKLDDLKRTAPKPHDSRIYPMQYAPIVIREDGETKIVLARYHCRGQGKPATIDKDFDGLYNARRNSLEKYWRGEFGRTHAVCVIEAFYENVDRDGKNVVLEFQPNPPKEMIVACLYARWTGADQPDLLSFAAITDEPPEEIRMAGHDRCVINLQPKHVETWLAPQGKEPAALQAILADVERPLYGHRAAEAA
jgi:putative SOS response-associated peptidase YedK